MLQNITCMNINALAYHKAILNKYTRTIHILKQPWIEYKEKLKSQRKLTNDYDIESVTYLWPLLSVCWSVNYNYTPGKLCQANGQTNRPRDQPTEGKICTIPITYRVFIKYCVFFEDFKIYSGLWPLSVSSQ